MTFVPLLAHPLAPENAFIGIMTVSAWVLLVVLGLHIARRLEIDSPGDLLLPFAVVVLVAGLTGSLGDTINDQGPWAVPAGVVALVALLVAAFRDVDFHFGQRRTYAVMALAVVAAIALYNPLENLWWPDNPEDIPLPALEDGRVTAAVVEPLADDGRLVVSVTLENATFGDNSPGPRPSDPETELMPRFQVGTVYLMPPIPEDCVQTTDCTEAEFELTLPPAVADDPPESLVVELLTADQLPFSPPLQARFELRPAD